MLTLMLRICVEATFFVALITIDADITVNSKNSSFQIALQKISIAQIDPQWRVEVRPEEYDALARHALPIFAYKPNV